LRSHLDSFLRMDLLALTVELGLAVPLFWCSVAGPGGSALIADARFVHTGHEGPDVSVGVSLVLRLLAEPRARHQVHSALSRVFLSEVEPCKQVLLKGLRCDLADHVFVPHLVVESRNVVLGPLRRILHPV